MGPKAWVAAKNSMIIRRRYTEHFLTCLFLLRLCPCVRCFLSPSIRLVNSVADKQTEHLLPSALTRGTPFHINNMRPKNSCFRALGSPSSLISCDDGWGNYAALIGSAALAQVLGKKTRIGNLLGAPVTAMALTFFAASVGILNPGGTVSAKSMQLLAIQLATPLVLLGADLRNVREQSGPLLISFCAAALGTLVASFVGWKYLAGPALSRALGRDGLVISAALMAKNIGGGINYIAVCRSLGASPTAVAAGLCVDNIFALIYFPITSALANPLPDVDSKKDTSLDTPFEVGPITAQTTTTALFCAAALVCAGEKLGGQAWALPVSSILTVLLASLAPLKLVRSLRPTADVMGMLALYLFFSTAGAPGLAVAESVRSSLLPIGLFLTSLYAIHGVLLGAANALFGKKFGAFSAQRLLVASSAAIGGPATATALASSAGWQSLMVPSILVGNIGYAIATFCGIGFYHFFQQ